MTTRPSEPTHETNPWNWCGACEQPVDLPGECFDGTEVKCIGCGGLFVAVVMTDGSWVLDPVLYEDHDPEATEP